MWFFVAVLVLWGATATMASWPYYTLPDIVDWGWWTFHLYACSIAAMTEDFTTLASRVMGLLGYTLIVVYYVTMSATYLQFIPSNDEYASLWPSVFLSVNLAGPILLITVGCAASAVQRR